MSIKDKIREAQDHWGVYFVDWRDRGRAFIGSISKEGSAADLKALAESHDRLLEAAKNLRDAVKIGSRESLSVAGAAFEAAIEEAEKV